MFQADFKPDMVVEIDLDHPLAHLLVFAVVPVMGEKYPRDLVSGIVPTDLAGSDRSSNVDIKGRTLTTPGSGHGLKYGRTGLDTLSSDTGLSVYGRWRSLLNAKTVAMFSTGENALGDGFQLRLDDIANVINGLIIQSNNAARTRTAFNVLGANSEERYHDVGFTHRVPSTVGQFYVSGKAVSSNTNTIISANSNRKTRLFSTRTSNGFGSVGMVYFYAFKTRLPDSVAASIYANPWQMLKPRKRFFGFSAAAGDIDLNLIVTTAALNVSTTNPIVVTAIDQEVTVSAVALNIVPTNPVVETNADLDVVVTSQALNISVTNPLITTDNDINVVVSQVALTIAPTNPVVVADVDREIIVTSESLSLVVTNPEITTDIDQTVAVSSVALNLTPTNPVVTLGGDLDVIVSPAVLNITVTNPIVGIGAEGVFLEGVITADSRTPVISADSNTPTLTADSRTPTFTADSRTPTFTADSS